MPTALTGYQSAPWAIALLALPAIFALIDRDELSKPAIKRTSRDAEVRVRWRELTHSRRLRDA